MASSGRSREVEEGPSERRCKGCGLSFGNAMLVSAVVVLTQSIDMLNMPGQVRI